MSSAIFDASVFVPLFVEMETSAPALRCAEQYEVVSLDHATIETANAFTRQVRTKRLAAEDAVVAYRSLVKMVRWLPTQPHVEDAFSLAMALDHAVYDCLYVAAARDNQLPLITADKKLARKFQDTLAGRIIDLYHMPETLP